MGVESSVTFQRLEQDWYRSDFDPFAQSARQFPYFFCSDAQNYPLEVAYVWTREDIRPSYADWDNFTVAWPLEGIGHL